MLLACHKIAKTSPNSLLALGRICCVGSFKIEYQNVPVFLLSFSLIHFVFFFLVVHRRLEVQYPHFPTEQEFTHSILSVGDLDQHSEGGKLCLLAKFSMEWRRLQRGGMLLPDLVEFYQWLHTNLSHLITYKRASNLTIGHVIKLAKQNSSKDYGGHLWDLYKRVEHHYNTYVELIGGAIGAGACAAVRQGNKIFTIADDIPLLHFLSGEQDSVTLCNSHSLVRNVPRFLP